MKPKKIIVSLMAPTKYTRAEEGNQLTRSPHYFQLADAYQVEKF